MTEDLAYGTEYEMEAVTQDGNDTLLGSAGTVTIDRRYYTSVLHPRTVREHARIEQQELFASVEAQYREQHGIERQERMLGLSQDGHCDFSVEKTSWFLAQVTLIRPAGWLLDLLELRGRLFVEGGAGTPSEGRLILEHVTRLRQVPRVAVSWAQVRDMSGIGEWASFREDVALDPKGRRTRLGNTT